MAHRYITRTANAGSENHISLSEQEFFTRAGQNLLALSWHANGFYYGVGVEIDLWLHAGFDVLVNGSRAHLPQARARYGQTLLPVCLQVSPDVLRHHACKTEGGKPRVRLTSGWSAPHAIRHPSVISSITTEVCYSQSII